MDALTTEPATSDDDETPGSAQHHEPSSPGVLRGETIMVLNTRQAQRVFEGRDPKHLPDGSRQAEIVGVKRFATYIRQVKVGANADDPYADLCLIELEREFQQAAEHYAEMLSLVRAKLENRKGISIRIAHSLRPLEIALRFSNQYAYKAAYLVADLDELAASVLTMGSDFFSQPGSEHYLLVGRIEDALSRSPLAGARVMEPDSTAVHSDSVGSFTIVVDGSGPFTLDVLQYGYANEQFTRDPRLRPPRHRDPP